eukprot:TRINITY_DN9206_c0_g1_i1.p1 TRINITY_DN9206_c0_g1~~TRINITY_DN9206_c0_g1_i1.p1  ORF type:complete len:273 (+),score=30.70 TRINITY_DN9206_c0_g1_i1:33-821(+)
MPRFPLGIHPLCLVALYLLLLTLASSDKTDASSGSSSDLETLITTTTSSQPPSFDYYVAQVNLNSQSGYWPFNNNTGYTYYDRSSASFLVNMTSPGNGIQIPTTLLTICDNGDRNTSNLAYAGNRGCTSTCTNGTACSEPTNGTATCPCAVQDFFYQLQFASPGGDCADPTSGKSGQSWTYVNSELQANTTYCFDGKTPLYYTLCTRDDGLGGCADIATTTFLAFATKRPPASIFSIPSFCYCSDTEMRRRTRTTTAAGLWP